MGARSPAENDPPTSDPSTVDARLAHAAENGEQVEVILVVRGKVRLARGAGGRRWRMRVEGQRVLTFPADCVVAATPVPAPGRDRKQ
jgi:hypothetical protein